MNKDFPYAALDKKNIQKPCQLPERENAIAKKKIFVKNLTTFGTTLGWYSKNCLQTSDDPYLGEGGLTTF
jgi:hypothetical protein